MSTVALLRDAPWLTDGATARVLTLLNAGGEEARVVGGAVRNALMGLPVADIDIATTALPEEVVRRAAAAHIKCVPTGLDHGTVTLVADGRPFEITTLREDVETFGRKARVAFGRDWRRDALRRDFTINGMSATADGVVHDEVGGLDDIAARRVRFIGDPAQRIAEDYLRILRFFRVHAAYGRGAPDRDAYLACIAARDGLSGLSAERLRMEMLKLVVAEGAAAALVAMDDGGLLLRIIGGVAYHGPFARMIAIERALGLPPDTMRRLGALGAAVTEDAERLAQRLRLSNHEARRLHAMSEDWWRLVDLDDEAARPLLYRLGGTAYRARAMFAWARHGADATDGVWQRRVALPERWTPPAFPLRAADFMARGMAPGAALGRALAAAEKAWIAAGFPSSADVLAEIADAAVAQAAG